MFARTRAQVLSAFGVRSSALPVGGNGQRSVAATSLSGARLTEAQRAALRAASRRLTPRPAGVSHEVAPGVLEHHGRITFKMPMHVMRGRASSVTWTEIDQGRGEGHIQVNAQRPDGKLYFVRMDLDLSDSQMSELWVD